MQGWNERKDFARTGRLLMILRLFRIFADHAQNSEGQLTSGWSGPSNARPLSRKPAYRIQRTSLRAAADAERYKSVSKSVSGYFFTNFPAMTVHPHSARNW
jgi:hypothetical protein